MNSARRTFQSEPSDSSHGPRSPGLCPTETIHQYIPGAFPAQTASRNIEEHNRTLSPSSTVDEVKHAFDVLSDYAKQYLPDSVGAYIGSKQGGDKPESKILRTELPSTEVPSGSRTGVGSLPGKTSEPAVAALPEEKAGRRFNAMTVPDSGPMSRVHRAPFFPSDKVSRGGVGSLPGTPNEIDVVRLPEERFHAVEVSSHDSHAPSNFVSSNISQEFPLPQRSSKSTNPFRNGQFASINSSPSRPALEHRRQYDEEDAASIPVYPEKFAGQAAGPVGSKEPYTFPEEELHVPTYRGRGTNPGTNSALTRDKREEVEITTYNMDPAPKNMIISPEPAVSEISSARIASVQSNTSTSCVAEHDSTLSTASPAQLGSKLAPEISRSSLQVPLTSVTPHLAALAAIGDIPTPEKERVFPVRAEFPTKPNTDLSDTMPSRFSEGNCASLAAGTTFAGTGVEAARPIIPSVNQSVQFQGQILPRAPSTHIQHLTTPSSSDASLSTQDPTSYPRVYGNGKGNPTVISEKVKENPEAKEEAPKGFLFRLSRWFYPKKLKLPLRREQEQETPGTSEESEESSERRDPFSGSEEEFAPSPPEDERNHHVVDGVEMGSAIDKDATEHQVSSDIDRPAIAKTYPISTMSQGTIRECLSTAFVGSGTLRHQSLHQPPATTIRAPVDADDNLGLERHHPGSYSPVIPKHVPAHFDETIGPLPDHVEKRSGKELPSQEKPGGSRVGIGSLPGDEGVALGPDEKYGTIAETTLVSHSPAHGGLGNTPSPEPSMSSIDALPLNAQTIGPTASSVLGTDSSIEAFVSSSTVPKRQSVLSGVERDTIDSSTHEGDCPSHLKSSDANSYELGDQGAQGGFFVGLVRGVEDMTESIGQIARRHVPESVGDYLPHYERLDEFSKIGPSHRGSSFSKISCPGRWSPQFFMTPLESVCGSPLGARIHVQRSEIQQEIDDLKANQGPLLDPTGQSSGPSTRLEKRVLKQPSTPLEISPHPSQFSTVDFRSPIAPFSTHEQISGNPADVTPAVKEQYMKFIVDEPGEMLGTGGSLPGYPGPAALSALIGERIYDEHMRAAGAQEPIQTTRNHTPRKSFPEPVAPRAGNFLSECIAVETEDDLSQESLTSQRHPAAKSQTCHTWASLAPQERSRGMAQSAAVTSQNHTASESYSTLTSALARPVDIGGGIGTSGLTRQPMTSLNRLETPTQVQCAVEVPRPLQPIAIPSIVKRPSGKGFGVDDLGKPTISGETGLKSFLDEHARGRTFSHN